MKKKLLALSLAIVMLLSLAACVGDDEKNLNGNADYELLTKDDVIQICIRSHASWPYKEDWKVWQYIEEGCGATLDILAIPESEYATKLNLMFTDAKTVPDIAIFNNKLSLETFARQGALIAVEDIEEYIPNIISFYDSLSEDEYSQKIDMKRSADGKQYLIPNFGREKTQNVKAWLYRKDIFDKHGLSVPTTYDELYDVCKKLKKIYPDSYPFALRAGLSALSVTGSSWKEYWEPGIYYDYNAQKWCFGAIDDIMFDVLAFHNKMISEGLLAPNFMTIPNSSWQELITTDRGFIMPDYQTRIDFFNSLARKNMPEFNLTAMVPPVANEKNGVAMVNKYNVDPYGLVICNSQDEQRIANAAKYMNWLYTDEAIELVSWGKKDETFELHDGKKTFITDGSGTQVQSLYGFNSYGSFSRIDSESVLVAESEDIEKNRDMVLEHTMPFANPASDVVFNDEEERKRAEIASEISSYYQEMIEKFLIGQESLSKFDEYVQNVKNMGVDDLLKIYETAYNRMLGK